MGDGGIFLAMGSGVVALLFVWYLASYTIKQDPGNERMQQISNLVQAGARAFLKREYTYVFTFVVIIGILIASAVGAFGSIILWKRKIVKKIFY